MRRVWSGRLTCGGYETHSKSGIRKIAKAVHSDHHFVARSKAERGLRTKPTLAGVPVENHTSPELQPHVTRADLSF